MKITYVIAAMAIAILITATAAAAAPAIFTGPRATTNPETNSGFNNECRDVHSNSYTIEKWEYDNSTEDYALDEESYHNFAINVTGDLQEANWTSDREIYFVLAKAGQNTTEYDGGLNGTINGLDKDISHITFCGKSSNGGSNGGGSNGVPEFPAFALGAAVITAALGIVFLRKK